MKKIIGIDMDGTLLTNDNKISAFTKQTLAEVTKNNHMVVLATGRSYFGAIKYYNELKLKTPLISLNGSLISMPDGKEYKRAIPSKTVNSIYTDLKDILVTAVFNCSNKLYSYNHNIELEKLFNGENIVEVEDFDIKNKNNDILNIVVLINRKDQKQFEDYFTGLKVSHRYWGEFEDELFYDIYLDGVSKASALQKVLSQYGMNSDNLITFGDGPNDIEMLTYAKDGVAMKNANDKVRESTEFVTEHDNDNDGVAHYLVKYYL